MSQFDEEYLEKLRAYQKETLDLRSNKRKPERERMMVRAFLRCLGVAFEDAEIQVGDEEPVDISFRTARFQVREILGGYKRGLVLKEQLKQYEAAETIADTMVPVNWPTPISFAEVTQIVAAELAEKAAHYGVNGCSKLDALLSVAIRRNLYPLNAVPDPEATAEFNRQGWRSVSMILLPYSVVIIAKPDASEFLKDRAGQILSKWESMDNPFEA